MEPTDPNGLALKSLWPHVAARIHPIGRRVVNARVPASPLERNVSKLT